VCVDGWACTCCIGGLSAGRTGFISFRDSGESVRVRRGPVPLRPGRVCAALAVPVVRGQGRLGSRQLAWSCTRARMELTLDHELDGTDPTSEVWTLCCGVLDRLLRNGNR
jgi:hypothetical protein